jgi:hypothetical protein
MVSVKVHTVKTFTANIYLGLKQGYSGPITPADEVRAWLQSFCNEARCGVSLSPTEFIYVDGSEPGLVIGFIQYPRFPRSIQEIKDLATRIAEGLLTLCQQQRVSIVFSDETVMLDSSEQHQ